MVKGQMVQFEFEGGTFKGVFLGYRKGVGSPETDKVCMVWPESAALLKEVKRRYGRNHLRLIEKGVSHLRPLSDLEKGNPNLTFRQKFI